MEFDRNAPGGGVEVECALENGKALLTWSFRFVGEKVPALLMVTMKDQEGNIVLKCLRQEPEEEPLQAVLLHPKLWNGAEGSYLYQAEVCLQGRDWHLWDRVSMALPLRRLELLPGKGYFLNGEAFQPKTVNYRLPEAASEAERQSRLFQDLELLLQLGANSICCIEVEKECCGLRKLCDKAGLLILPDASEVSFRGEEQSLIEPITNRPSALYYRYKTCWSRQPFVYIVPESVKKMNNGCYKTIVYSNCGKVALYTDGVLFEVRTGEKEFAFEEIPARHPCVMLTAEADGCSMSYSVHKFFT